MKHPDIPENERERLLELKRLHIDRRTEQTFDDIARLTARICGVPIALVSLLESDHQWFKACYGLEGVTGTSRQVSFCGHAILEEDFMEVKDASKDPRFFDNPLVTESPHIRYYGGMPLVTQNGFRLGTLCVIDHRPNQLAQWQLEALKTLAGVVVELFEARLAEYTVREQSRRQQLVLDHAMDAFFMIDAKGRITEWSQEAERMFGLPRPAAVGRHYGFMLPSAEETEVCPFQCEPQAGAIRFESTARRDDGTSFPVELSVMPLRADDLVFYSVFARDITERRHMQLRLEQLAAESHDRFRSLFSSNPDPVFILDANGTFIDVNPAATTLFGYTQAEFAQLTLADIVVPEEVERARACFVQALMGEPRQAQWCVRDKQGIEHEIRTTSLPMFAEGQVAGVFGIAQDMTQRNRYERALRNNEEEYRGIFEQAAVGIAHIAPDGKWLRVNRKLEEITGYTREEMLERHLQDILHPDDLDADIEGLKLLLCGEVATYSREKRYIRANGTVLWVNSTLSLHRDPTSGAPQYLITVVQDINDRQLAQQRIEYLATHDLLTGLLNRHQLELAMPQALAASAADGHRAAVLFIDLERFKLINDSFGHLQGDDLLRTVGTRLQRVLGEQGIAARFGGDEFVVLLSRVADSGAVAEMAELILKAIDEPVTVQGNEFSISASIGISQYPDDGQDAQTLLLNADTAMYRAKLAHAGSYRFYNPQMGNKKIDRLLLEHNLRRAVEHHEFEVYYQPRIGIGSGRIDSMEALIRWQHPERGLVMPLSFIGVAEEIGLISRIGEWVLRQACQQLRAWRDKGLGGERVSVNVSAQQLQSSQLPDIVRRALDETGLPANALELEITESSLMQDVDHAMRILQSLRDMGVRLSIDDFGTGYSSLNYLSRLPIDALKIDKSFIQDVPDSTDSTVIVQATLSLARDMQLEVIAEGVTTEQQAQFLARLGCDELQGYLFSKPLPGSEMEALLQRGQVFNIAGVAVASD